MGHVRPQTAWWGHGSTRVTGQEGKAANAAGTHFGAPGLSSTYTNWRVKKMVLATGTPNGLAGGFGRHARPPPHLPAAPPPLDDAGGVDAQGVLRCCSVLRWAGRWVRLSSGHHPRIPRRGKWVGCKHWSGIEMRGGGVPLPPSPVSNDTSGGANENF